jgi:hypothetical protein
MDKLSDRLMSEGDGYVCRHVAGDEGILSRIDQGTVFQDDFRKSFGYGYAPPVGGYKFPPFAEVCQ